MSTSGTHTPTASAYPITGTRDPSPTTYTPLTTSVRPPPPVASAWSSVTDLDWAGARVASGDG